MSSLEEYADKISKIYDSISIKHLKTNWKGISEELHSEGETFAQTYRYLRKDDTRYSFNMNYDLTLNDLNTLIKQAQPIVSKIGNIILALHKIVYNYLVQKDNYSLQLDGKKEVAILDRDLIYSIHVSDKVEKNIFFHAFILIFSLESLFNKNLYIGMDFEFTGIDPVHKRKAIQMMQMNYEHNKDNNSIIMIVSPKELDQVITKNFIRLIMCNTHIRKLLHGPDALDIPYVYKEMMEGDTTKIIKFTKSMIETKLICEYYKLNRPNIDIPDKKCSIYEAVAEIGVISADKKAELDQIEEALPHPTERLWNIHKLATSQLMYSQYDVIFLKHFYYRMIFLATEETSDPLQKKNIINLYKNIIFEMTQLSYLDSDTNEITFMRVKCKEEVDPINNYMIRHPTKVMKLIDIFNQISPGITTIDPVADIDKLLKVSYYKTLLVVILKKMTYTLISQKHKIFKDKTTIWNEKLSNGYVFEFLEKLGFNHLSLMFKQVEKVLDTRIRMLFVDRK